VHSVEVALIRDGLRVLVPDPAGALWIGLLVTFLVFADFPRPFGPRNRALLGLLALAPLLLRILALYSGSGAIAPWVFTAVYLITAGQAVWAATLAFRMRASGWRPNLDRPALAALVAVLVAINAVVVFGRFPDDAGYYTNLGAQRWTETGTLPYADPLLKGADSPAFGASATYGPILYTAHVPVQWLLGASRNAASLNPMDKAYIRPPVMATQIVCFAFYLVGLASLYLIVRRLADPTLALAAVALYACSPYVLGLGGPNGVVTGLAYVSHIAPSSLMLAALAAISYPAASGLLLALAAGTLFYPVFVFPLWVSWLASDRRAAVRFALSFAITGIVILAGVVWFTHAPSWSNAMSLFLESTLEHQEGVGPKAYGASHFGFWGTHPGLAAFWQSPLFGTTSLFKPTFILYSLLALGACFMPWARTRSIPQLAALTAMLTAAVQLWKTHAAGSYVEWYYPFLIVALVAAVPDLRSRRS
jgi:hypothetical protein